MSKLILAVTKTVTPDKKTSEVAQTIVVESDKITILPLESNTKSLVMANGFQWEVEAEVAELASAMSATDASAYT